MSLSSDEVNDGFSPLSSGPDEDDRFLQYLRTVIGNPSALSKVKTSHDALKIYRVIRDAERALDKAGWSLLARHGGFVVPPSKYSTCFLVCTFH